jgi:hypothetical protein
MMHVDPAKEPSVFNDRVRIKGQKYLATVPNPTTKQWSSHDYWVGIKFELHAAYCGICHFGCHWIPQDNGAITVEHYKPKATYPADAYEWNNYRLMSGTLNGRKSHYEDVLDPFQITNGTFILEFPSLMLKPAPGLASPLRDAAVATIKRLKLNDEGTCIKARERFVKHYCKGNVDFAYLKDDAPFIAFELDRQKLIANIKNMMVFS